jgi:hypothetical protein
MDTDPAPLLDEPEDHDRGLQFDLSRFVGRLGCSVCSPAASAPPR